MFEKIFFDVERQYENLDSPSYHFVYDDVITTVYKSIFNIFSINFHLIDYSDLNYSVCYSWELSTRNRKYTLDLSLVGLYGIFTKKKNSQIITIDSIVLDESEKYIINLLNSEKIKLLDKKILFQKLPISLENVSAKDSTVYNALFHDSDLNPNY